MRRSCGVSGIGEAIRLASILCCLAGALGAATLIPAGATWNYDATGTDLGTDWKTIDYDDAAWSSGAAQLGYGEGDEATTIPYGSDAAQKFPTYYFRHSFTVANPTAFKNLQLKIVRDDGCVVYLNDQEVLRANMPAGDITYATLASVSVGGAEESAWFAVQIDPATLIAGTNVMAVEVHQQNLGSSDISFNLSLDDTPPAPVVTLQSPADDKVLATTTVTLTCAATDANGLKDATLYLGKEGTTFSFSGPDQAADASISADTPDVNQGADVQATMDGTGPHAHIVMKFPRIFNNDGGPVPRGVEITEATLQVNCLDPGSIMKIYRLTEDWVEEEVTWKNRSAETPWTDLGADGTGSHAGEAVDGDCTVTGLRTIDVTSLVQAWSDGATNYGMVFVNSGDDGVDFSTSESTTNPPVLTIRYGGSWNEIQTKPLSGTSASATFTTTLGDNETYRWNCLVTNAGGLQSWAPAHFNFTVQAGGPTGKFIRGDVNQDQRRNIADVLKILGELFGGQSSSGCQDAGDCNDDGRVNIADPLRLLGFLFGGQPDLPLPSNNTCGVDPTVDDLPSCTFSPCAGP